MNIETKANLNDETICKLQDLIRVNIDSYEGFREAAEQIEDTNVATMFKQLAEERSNLATELQQHVEWNGEEAADDGTLFANVHRTWLNVRSMLNGGDSYAILAEAERGEDYIKAAYEDVLKETAGSAMNAELQRQYLIVKKAHDRVRDLRDAFKNAK